MDKRFFFAFLFLVASAQMTLAQSLTVNMKGDKTAVYNLSDVADITFSETDYQECEYVDLGLPSGTLWATTNVGASTPEEAGDFFAWGETDPKDNYYWSSYKYSDSVGETMTKYNTTDGITELLPEDDAATANRSSEWETPSISQISELLNYTTQTWTKQNDVYGRLCTASNGNSIFFPAMGNRYSTNLNVAGAGYYWSRSRDGIYANQAYFLGFYEGDMTYHSFSRYYGKNVRPVRKILASGIVLDKTQLNLNADIGQTEHLTATVLPNDFVSNKEVAWESSDKYVASVDQTGLVKAITPGTCTITCRATDGSGVYAECKVTVGGRSSNDSWD